MALFSPMCGCSVIKAPCWAVGLAIGFANATSGSLTGKGFVRHGLFVARYHKNGVIGPCTLFRHGQALWARFPPLAARVELMGQPCRYGGAPAARAFASSAALALCGCCATHLYRLRGCQSKERKRASRVRRYPACVPLGHLGGNERE